MGDDERKLKIEEVKSKMEILENIKIENAGPICTKCNSINCEHISEFMKCISGAKL
jgi:hypothetical protein